MPGIRGEALNYPTEIFSLVREADFVSCHTQTHKTKHSFISTDEKKCKNLSSVERECMKEIFFQFLLHKKNEFGKLKII